MRYPGDKKQTMAFSGGLDIEREFIDRQVLVGDDGVVVVGICEGVIEGRRYNVTIELWPDAEAGKRIGGVSSVCGNVETIQGWLNALDNPDGVGSWTANETYDGEHWQDSLKWDRHGHFTITMGTPSRSFSVTLSGLGCENLYEILDRAKGYLQKNETLE